MPIIKTSDFVEVYRLKAGCKDISVLTGRTGRNDITRFIAQRIADHVPWHTADTIVDIGCGDCTFLELISSSSNTRRHLFGLLPTEEEVTRVHAHLCRSSSEPLCNIVVRKGQAEHTGLPTSSADLVVCNGVLLLLENSDRVNTALDEIVRILRPGGIGFLGEIPDHDEMSGRTYGASIGKWLFFLFTNRGLRAFFDGLLEIVRALATNTPFIIAPKNIYHVTPEAFVAKLKQKGLELIATTEHQEVDINGQPAIRQGRWNYVVRKAAAYPSAQDTTRLKERHNDD